MALSAGGLGRPPLRRPLAGPGAGLRGPAAWTLLLAAVVVLAVTCVRMALGPTRPSGDGSSGTLPGPRVPESDEVRSYAARALEAQGPRTDKPGQQPRPWPGVAVSTGRGIAVVMTGGQPRAGAAVLAVCGWWADRCGYGTVGLALSLLAGRWCWPARGVRALCISRAPLHPRRAGPGPAAIAF
ncbi:hypothetical protein [Streptomyces sp. NBC_00105]|uniref:hypothetical protein n=1 Tax=Streptomyces sp. NBC_00105 TaxID=2903622 RepID=UPI00324E8F26